MALLQTIVGQDVCPLGLAGNPEMEPDCVPVAFDAGMNGYFFYTLSFDALVSGVKELAGEHRDRVLISTGIEDRDGRRMKTYLDEARKALQIDTVDAFFAEYVAPSEKWEDILGALDDLQAWKAQGLIRYVGASVHDRTLALALLQSGRIDVLMHRYNMAHRKSEDEVLPMAVRTDIPVISFTNTRWGSLLKGHKSWSGDIPTAGDCYRFVLRHPAVKMAWMAPRTVVELESNLSVLTASRMMGDEVALWKTYGDLVYGEGMDAFETRWP